MSAWGKTGRVTLVPSDHYPEVCQLVEIDGDFAGMVWHSTRGTRAGLGHGWASATPLPTRDAAILWVLRRVDPALWRQERGEVWTVKRGPEIRYVARWHVHAPSPDRRILFSEGNPSPCPSSRHDDSYEDWRVAVRVACDRAATR